jgi:hypothetical protein
LVLQADIEEIAVGTDLGSIVSSRLDQFATCFNAQVMAWTTGVDLGATFCVAGQLPIDRSQIVTRILCRNLFQHCCVPSNKIGLYRQEPLESVSAWEI